MKEKFDQVNAAITRLEEIHARQIDDFNEMLMPDLETQSRERHQGVEQLKKQIAGFIELAGEVPDQADKMIRRLNDRISILVEQNRALADKARAHRDGLRQSLKGLEKGNRAIGAYGSPAYIANRPRAINLMN